MTISYNMAYLVLVDIHEIAAERTTLAVKVWFNWDKAMAHVAELNAKAEGGRSYRMVLVPTETE